jgi:hypothetical protein
MQPYGAECTVIGDDSGQERGHALQRVLFVAGRLRFEEAGDAAGSTGRAGNCVVDGDGLFDG